MCLTQQGVGPLGTDWQSAFEMLHDSKRCFDCRFKQNVWNSRINSASSIVRAIEASSDKPEVFINISGVALYKPDDKDHDETESGSCYDFMSALCIDWEKAATLSPDIPTRNVFI